MTYDNAGNLTSYNGMSNTWDYLNRLLSTTKAGTSTSYLYDHTGQRVTESINKGSGTTTTTYFNRYYETTGATTTLYVFLPSGELLATIEGNGSATSTYVAHTDHLNGTNVMSDKNGALAQLATYYPFGAKRNNELPSNGFVEKRGFIGQYEDTAVALSYLQQRYYDATRGQFLSQDPLVKKIGLEIEAVQKLLLDPQMLNYYSYARNNPINYSDPNGEAAQSFQQQLKSIQLQIMQIQLQVLQMAVNQYQQYSSGVKQGVEHPIDSAKTVATGKAPSVANGVGQAVGVTAIGIITVGPMVLSGGSAAPVPFILPKATKGNALLETAEPVGSALKNDLFHRAPTFMREKAAKIGTTFETLGDDGAKYFLTQMEGAVNETKGVFEYVVNSSGNLTHQLFKPGGIIDGIIN